MTIFIIPVFAFFPFLDKRNAEKDAVSPEDFRYNGCNRFHCFGQKDEIDKLRNTRKELLMKKWRKLQRTALVTAASLGMTGTLIAPSVMTVLAAEDTPEASVSVYPKPQSMAYDADSRAGMKFDGKVDIVVKAEKGDVWSGKLEEILTENGIEFEYADAVNADHATILISLDKADLPKGVEDEENVLDKKEGYVLFSDNDINAKGQITLIGADQQGIWNGVLSLKQLIDQKNTDGNFAEVELNDYPDIPMRGYVEGFYGLPWSPENRILVAEHASEYKINTYIYAPKDDPYHKDQWRDLYPDEDLAKLKALVDTCKANNVEFIWCAHPGNGYNYSGDTDYNKLIAKIEQLYSIGVRRFGLSYDDLGGNSNGANQSALITRVGNYLDETHGDCGPMFTVGQRYTDGWGSDWNIYLKPFLEGLKDEVVVMWTGKNTGGNIDADAFDGPKNKLGYDQQLGAWFNYPVNDMAFGRILMGAVDNMDPELEGLRGFFMNPMNQAQASKVSIFQGADYSWNIHDYDYNWSWDQALKAVSPDHTAALKRYADNTSKHSFEDIAMDESKELQPILNAFDAAVVSGENFDEAFAALRAKFDEMLADANELLAMEDAPLLADLESHLKSYKDMAEAGIAAMDAFEAATQLDSTVMNEKAQLCATKLADSNKHTILAMNRTNGYYQVKVEVGTGYIKPFLGSITHKLNKVFANSMSAPAVDEIISSSNKATGTIAIENGNYVITVNGTLRKNQYAGVALAAPVMAKTITANAEQAAKAANLKAEYSLNGVEWKDVADLTENAPVTFVRFLNTGEETVTLKDATITINAVYPEKKVSVSCNIPIYQGSYNNMIDGNFTTKLYGDEGGNTTSNHVTLDLGAAIPLNDAQIYFAQNPKGPDHGVDGFLASQLEVSLDGSAWKKVGDVLSYEEDEYEPLTIEGNKVFKVNWSNLNTLARYVRFSPTVDDGNWVQVYEAQVNTEEGFEYEIGDNSIDLIETEVSGNPEKMFDGDMTSSFTLDAPAAGDAVVYNFTTQCSVKDILIFQNADKLSNATLSVQNYDGTWTTLGKLDAQRNQFDLNKHVKALKVEFEEGTPVAIQEIAVRTTDTRLPGTITSPEAATNLNTAVLDYTLNEVESKDFNAFIQNGIDALRTAVAKATAVLNAPETQEQIDNAALELNDSYIRMRLTPNEELLNGLE